MVAMADVVRELKALRKGRGLLANHIGDRIGSALRRIDAAIEHVAQLATMRRAVARPAARGADGTATGWHTAELRVIVALDRERPEVVELHRIVAEQDDLTSLRLPVTSPVDVLY